jgi:hypothetical protein
MLFDGASKNTFKLVFEAFQFFECDESIRLDSFSTFHSSQREKNTALFDFFGILKSEINTFSFCEQGLGVEWTHLTP